MFILIDAVWVTVYSYAQDTIYSILILLCILCWIVSTLAIFS